MIFRPLTVICLVAFLGFGLYVYQTKHEAMVQDRELRSIVRKIEEAEARTQTLQAEWAWLNEPERLRSVVQRHLPTLEPMQPAQFVRITEAERRLPAVAAYTGPIALFAPRESQTPAGTSSFALLPRIADPVQVAVAAPAVTPAAPVAAPVAVPAVQPAAPPPAAPAAAPAADTAAAVAAPPPVRLALPAVPPRPAEPAVVARHAEPRSATIELARVIPSRPVARPAPRPAPEAASLPSVAARAPRPAVTQVAAAAAPRPVVPQPSAAPSYASQSYPAPGYAGGSALGGGSRPLLPPPVPFGSAGAATLGGLAR